MVNPLLISAPRLPRATGRLFRVAACGLVLLTLGCRRGGSTEQPRSKCKPLQAPDWPIQVLVSGTPRMNANAQAKPLDTQIKVMQLRSIDRLKDLSIHELWDQAEQKLGPDLLHSVNQTVLINRPVKLRLDLAPGARLLVIAAWLRNPAGNRFWQAVRLPLDYQVGMCAAKRRELPPPCVFASINHRSVDAGLTPPRSFRPDNIQARCPTIALLHHATAQRFSQHSTNSTAPLNL